MHATTLLLALAGSHLASANLAVPAIAHRALEARQTDEAGMSACLSAIESVMTATPTIPSILTAFFESQTVDVCSISVPKQFQSAYTSYESAIRSWYTAHSAQLSSALSACPDAERLTDGLDSTCTGAAPGGNSGSEATATESEDEKATSTLGKTGAGSASTTASSPGATGAGSGAGPGSGNGNGAGSGTGAKSAGNRETGVLGAAIAIAGFLGVVVML